MATTTILEPDNIVGTVDDGFVVTGSGKTTLTAVNDSDDASYIRKPATNTTYDIYWNIASVTLNETNAIPWRFRVLARMAQGASGSTALRVFRKAQTIPQPGTIMMTEIWPAQTVRSKLTTGTVALAGSGTTSPVPAATVTGDYIDIHSIFDNVSSAGWRTLSYRQIQLNDLQINFRDASTSASRATLYAIWAELDTTGLPTTAISQIDATTASPWAATSTSRPLISWTYTQADAIPQSYYEISIFSASTANPSSTTNRLWTSGQVASSTARSATPRFDFINGTTYYVYVRTGFTLGQTTYWSSWSTGAAVSTTLTAPTTPTLTATWDSANQRASLFVNGSAYASGTQTFTVERSDDGGSTYNVIRNGSSIAPDGSTDATVYDYELARTGSVKYRAQAVGVISGQVVSGSYTTVQTLTPTSDGKHWLKAPTSSSLNVGSVRILADPSFDIEEQTTTLRPLGRSEAVVISGAIGVEDGSFEILADSSDWAAIKAIVTAQTTLLWQDPFGTQRYIRITSRSYDRFGSSSSPRYRISCSFVGVASP